MFQSAQHNESANRAVRHVVYDIETRSELSLKNYGSHVYACHPSTDVWCVSYCIVTDGVRGPTSTWLPCDPIPTEILEAAADSDTPCGAFSDAFERQVGTIGVWRRSHPNHPNFETASPLSAARRAARFAANK